MGGGSERNQGMFQPFYDLDLNSPASKTIRDAGLTDIEKPTSSLGERKEYFRNGWKNTVLADLDMQHPVIRVGTMYIG